VGSHDRTVFGIIHFPGDVAGGWPVTIRETYDVESTVSTLPDPRGV
jgi:hypothetical protein